VVVTRVMTSTNHYKAALAGLSILFGVHYFSTLQAGVLPEDRSDALYHSYDGGGVTVSGPSILVRKSVLEDFSVSANYYVDMVSSASIDVITTASEYSEERTQYSIGVDYLNDSTTVSMNFTNSSESDYEANTSTFSISQDFFSNLTTLAIGYSIGSDTVGRNGQDDFAEDVGRQNYRVDLSQIISKNFVMTLAMEGITDTGFLNNPYRSVRFLDPTVALGYGYQAEIYPDTKTSTSAALAARYFLPYRAAIHAEYRAYSDTWGVTGNSFELGYVHPFDDHLTFEVTTRVYSQGQADFYNDLFPFQDAQNFLARDKELSTFDSKSLGFGVSYDFKIDSTVIDKLSLNLFYNYFQFDYKNFRDLRLVVTPGTEPFYQLDATVIRAYVSIWY